MIKDFRHKGLERLFTAGSKKGIRPEHTQRLKDILFRLDHATKVEDMNFPGARLHELKGNRAGIWSVTASGNWRVLFRFEGGRVWNTDYEDYH